MLGPTSRVRHYYVTAPLTAVRLPRAISLSGDLLMVELGRWFDTCAATFRDGGASTASPELCRRRRHQVARPHDRGFRPAHLLRQRALLLLWLVRSSYVLFIRQEPWTGPFGFNPDEACRQTGASCGAVTGIVVSLLTLAAATSLFLLRRLRALL
jgi:hypothetical protein